MILQMIPLVMNQVDWTHERFLSSEVIDWLEDHCGPIIKHERFGCLADRQVLEAKSFFSLGRIIMSPGPTSDYFDSLKFQPKPMSFEQHIEAEGWRYDRVWCLDLTKQTVNFQSKNPVPGARHELEILDDDLALMFRLAWL